MYSAMMFVSFVVIASLLVKRAERSENCFVVLFFSLENPSGSPGLLTTRVRPSAPSLLCARRKHTCRITCSDYLSLRLWEIVFVRDTSRITGVVLLSTQPT